MSELRCLNCGRLLYHKEFYIEVGMNGLDTKLKGYLCSDCYQKLVDLMVKKYPSRSFLVRV